MSWAFCCTRRGRLPSPNGFPSYSTLPHSVKRGWPAYRPDMACSSVDLPEPDGPSSTVMLPRGKVRSMSARTTLAPKAAPKPADFRQCVLLFMFLMGGIVPVRGQSRPTENRSACTDQRTKRPPERGQRRFLFYGVVRAGELLFRHHPSRFDADCGMGSFHPTERTRPPALAHEQRPGCASNARWSGSSGLMPEARRPDRGNNRQTFWCPP